MKCQYIQSTIIPALAGVAQLAGGPSHNQKVAGSIPSRGTFGRQPIDASVLH